MNYWTIIRPSNEKLFRVVKSTYAAAMDIRGNLKPYYFTSKAQAKAVEKKLNDKSL